jgi:hypothetical protein
MRITKKDFIATMTANHTHFAGITKRLYAKDEVYCALSDLFKGLYIVEMRSCVARSRDIVFNDDSHLYIGGEMNTTYTFHKYTYPEGDVLICEKTYFDVWDDCTRTKVLYYLIRN